MTLEIIESRERDLGDGFKVRRLLPAVSRKMVGPFIFLDHMGPAHLAKSQGLDVRPHPHINLATVTYLFEGEILHRDSVGSNQIIRPGDINWMTAGRGIVHSERTPESARSSEKDIDGIQCWVALPLEHEETEPSFTHYSGCDIPEVVIHDVKIKVLVGDAFNVTSPVRCFSDILYLDVQMPAGSKLTLPTAGRELAIYGAHGQINVNGNKVAEKALVVNTEADIQVVAVSAARVMIAGGQPLPEKRYIWWNFVSSSKDRIEKAKSDWEAGLFPVVPGDDKEFIPLPPNSNNLKLSGTIM